MVNLIENTLKSFLPPLEGFSAVPYWDHKQWSWGYGTRVPGSTDNKDIRPSGNITRERALNDAMAHVEADYLKLEALVTIPLTANQWSALLSFSYNVGIGNADNLVPNINARAWTALEAQWKKYIYASGVVNQTLVARRNKEWSLWTS